MNLRSGPVEYMVFEQLKLIERRRLHILNSVIQLIGRDQTHQCLQQSNPKIQEKQFEISPDDIIDEIDSKIFIRRLAFELEFNEAHMIQVLLSSYPHETELPATIFYGAQIAGQEAARNYSMKHEFEKPKNLTQLQAALSYLIYSGLPSDKYFFYSLRPLSDISVHYNKCTHLKAWNTAGIDPTFMCRLQTQWIRGVLDILAPSIIHNRIYSIANGNKYGLDSYISQEKLVPL